MPSALSKMGIFLGIFVIAWAGLTAGFGLYLQTRCARYVDRGHVSFAALSQLTYPNLSILFDAAIAIKCFGVAVSYLIIIGDLMPRVVVGFAPQAGDTSFLVDRQFWITAFMCASYFSSRPSLCKLTPRQARCHPTLLPPPPRLPQIHLRHRPLLHRLPRYPRPRPLPQRRHARRPGPRPRLPMVGSRLRARRLPRHRLRIHMPPEHVLHPQRDIR